MATIFYCTCFFLLFGD